MTDPSLILHKVRGEPAFDIATKLECPRCHGIGTPDAPEDWPYRVVGCDECDGTGEWWIIPTSGHRAHPYWSQAMNEIQLDGYPITYLDSFMRFVEMPQGWPDHYPSRSGDAPKIDLSSVVAALIQPSEPVERRF